MSTEAIRGIEEIKARANKAVSGYRDAVFTLGAAETTNDERYWAELITNANKLEAELKARTAALCQALEIAVKALEEIWLSKLSRAPLTQTPDQRIAKATIA